MSDREKEGEVEYVSCAWDCLCVPVCVCVCVRSRVGGVGVEGYDKWRVARATGVKHNCCCRKKDITGNGFGTVGGPVEWLALL